RLSRERLRGIRLEHGIAGDGLETLDEERARIDEDLVEIGEVVRLAVEDQQASLCRDRDAHFIGDLLARASQERLLGDEDLDALPELATQIAGESAIERNAPV